MATTISAETVFKALADETRQRMLRVLHGQELSVSELVEVLGQPQSTVSRHLKVLREAELIHDRRQGTTVLYSLRAGANGSDLSARLVDWSASQALPRGVANRLAGVLRRRREMSDRFFDAVGRQWDDLREKHFGTTFHLEALISLLPRTWTVVDVGTGTGYLLPLLASQFDRVIGIEPVPSMLEAAQHRVDAEHLARVELKAGDLAALPLADDSVDLAIAMLVLHHVPSPPEALGELHRVVAPGGRLLIVEQHTHSDEAFRERMQDRWWGFDREALAERVRHTGVRDVVARDLTPADGAGDSPGLFVITGMK
jgi:ArsR family transcriptional regulator